MERRLNLGCGTDIKPGWENLDSAAIEGVQIVHDLNVLPLPFSNATYSEIACLNILEHVDYIPLLREVHRILKPGGRVHIQVPHFTSRNNFDDPTHIHQFSLTTFAFFLKTHPRNYYFDFQFAELKDRKLLFETSKYLLFNHLVQWLFPLLPAPRFLYEGTFLRSLLPAESIRLTLVK
jgi:predicted SAM-dependent methyltransferase